MKRAILLLMVAATNACLERPELPQVPALAVAELSADDLEVVSAAWTATLRLEYENADAVPNSVVTPDKTIRACNVPEYQPSTYDCIEARDLIIVDGLMREFFGAMGPTTFHRRNSTTNQIRGEIQGMEVVPGDTLLELLQQPR